MVEESCFYRSIINAISCWPIVLIRLCQTPVLYI